MFKIILISKYTQTLRLAVVCINAILVLTFTCLLCMCRIGPVSSKIERGFPINVVSMQMKQMEAEYFQNIK